MVDHPGNGFDAEFATPAEWARLYRTFDIQVVPAFMPGEAKGSNWKRPLLRQWTQYQDVLVGDDVFEPWYGPAGQYRQRPNMGVITGKASGNLFVVDLDTHTKPQAAAWWCDLMELENNGLELETVEQRTGGGGLQKLFHAPAGWTPPTCKTDLGVDIRGQGGFAMLCPSLHESGRAYEWLEGRSPDEIDIAMAPGWLLAAVEALVVAHGGSGPAPGGARPRGANGPQEAFDGFGHQTDGREEYMRDLIWAAVIDWYRECPIPPGPAEQLAKESQKYLLYENEISPRIRDPLLTKTQLLDREGRGPTAFHVKWQQAMKHWDGKVAEEAKQPGKSGNYRASYGSGFTDFTDEFAKASNSSVLPKTLILTPKEFLEGFKPPDYLVDGMLQKSYLISLTARTGHGKTAIAMLLGACIARGVPFQGKPVEQGGVLFLAGENPDDIRARYLALASHEGFDPVAIPFHFIDGVINIQLAMAQIAAEAAKIERLSLVIVDTQAAFFLGDEGNSNEQQKWFAQLLRQLVKLPGHPAVLVNCHPVKNATQDNLVPMGGSAFLNEVDANLTLWADDKVCVMGPHPDKWRGVAFEVLTFELRTINCDALKDTRGRPIPSVIAVPVTEGGAARRAAVTEEDEKTVLRLVHAEKNTSLVSIARNAGWFWPDGQPAKSKVQKILDRLHKGKVVYRQYNGKYRLTKSGCRIIGVPWGSDDEE